MEPANHVLQGGSDVVEPAYHLVEGGDHLVQPALHLVQGGHDGVQPASHRLQAGDDLVEPAYHRLQGGDDLVEPAYHRLQGGDDVVQPAKHVHRGGEDLLGSRPQLVVPAIVKARLEPLLDAPSPRVYPAAAMTEAPLRHTSLYAEHVALGGRLVPFAGWELPIQYSGIVSEHTAVRTAAGMFDVSHMGELRLRGEYSEHVVDYLVTNDARKLFDGQAMYTCVCNERGTILDDVLVYRRTEDDWLIVCNSSNRAKISAHFAHAAKDHCDFEDQSDETALIAVQGPRAMEVLAKLGDDGARLGELKSFHFRDAVLGGVACTPSRTGYTGEDGVEIFCAWDDAPALWRALLEAGRPLGLAPAGLGARDTLRLEARLSLYGNDIDETTNPLEAGLGWVVKVEKGDFIGRAALMEIKGRPLPRKLVGLEVTGRGVARHGYPLRDVDGREVGVCTSGSPAPTVGKNIGLGYLPSAMTEVGTRLLVDCRGKNIEAVVAKTPFYKRAK